MSASPCNFNAQLIWSTRYRAMSTRCGCCMTGGGFPWRQPLNLQQFWAKNLNDPIHHITIFRHPGCHTAFHWEKPCAARYHDLKNHGDMAGKSQVTGRIQGGSGVTFDVHFESSFILKRQSWRPAVMEVKLAGWRNIIKLIQILQVWFNGLWMITTRRPIPFFQRRPYQPK